MVLWLFLFVLLGYIAGVIIHLIYLQYKLKEELKIRYPCAKCGKIIESKYLQRKYCEECSKKLNNNHAKNNYKKKKEEGLF